MPITRSRALEIEHLLNTLLTAPAHEREAAAARLRVIGARAVDHLLGALDTLSPTERCLLLPLLEDLPDSRVLTAVLPLAAAPETSAAALAVVQRHLPGALPTRRRQALEALRLVATDKELPLAARALAAELAERAEADREPTVRTPRRERGSAQSASESPQEDNRAAADDLLAQAIAGRVHGTPEALRAALARLGDALQVAELQDLVVAIAATERGARGQEAVEWAGVRAATHQLLAARHSRLGMADLRDTVERWHDSLPVGFIVALGHVGDAEALESLAAAHDRAESEWVREQVLGACRQLMQRLRLTRRHGAVRRAMKRSPDLASRL